MDLDQEYESIANEAIRRGLITKEEWETKYSKYRDQHGHSFCSYLQVVFIKQDTGENMAFCTKNQIMLDNKVAIEAKFGVIIDNLETFIQKNKDKEIQFKMTDTSMKEIKQALNKKHNPCDNCRYFQGNPQDCPNGCCYNHPAYLENSKH